ncbi:MAG: PQQ-binding-like beta-propeller repeat protein [Planctomycetes bacterium]|nr:PQQ-binding-like beta-propeller repeat protein [Planctomycetota bacterium]
MRFLMLLVASVSWLPSSGLGQNDAPVRPDAKTMLWSLETQSPSFGSGAVADLDGDGKLEIVFGCYFRDETLRCLDAKSGKVLWSKKSAGGPLDASVLVVDLDGKKGLETVFADSAHGKVWCLDARGGELWIYQGPSGTDSPPAAADMDGDGDLEVVYGTMKVRGKEGRVVQLDGKTGKELWTVEIPGHVQSEPGLVDLDDDGHLDVLVTNWMGDGMLRALNGKTGKELWRFETGDWIYHGISAADLDGDQAPEILVTDRAGTVTLLEGESGVVAWQVQLNNEAKGMVFGPTTLVDSDGEGALEIVVCGRNLHVLDAKGKLRWEKSFGYRSMARGVSAADVDGDGNQDLVFGEGQNLRALRAKDGEQLWAWDLGDPDKPGDHIDHAPLLADFDGDGFLDVFVVIGRGRSGEEAKNNRGRAWALHAGKGKASPTNTWTTFRGSNRRLGHRLP